MYFLNKGKLVPQIADKFERIQKYAGNIPLG